jgi:PKD repeat protein
MLAPSANGSGPLVLFGGAGAGGALRNDTWEFGPAGWIPIAPTCSPSCPPGLSLAGFAADPQPAVNASILFGGCLGTAACTAYGNETWAFSGGGPRWMLDLPAARPSARDAVGMAYDPDLGAIVLFGGEGTCGATTCAESDTWLFSGTTWTNVSGTIGGSRPGARVDGALEWDPASSELLLSGGRNSTDGPPANTSYALRCASSAPSGCSWTGPLSGPVPDVSGAAVPGNASTFDPSSVGGAGPDGTPSNTTWVFSAVPDLNLAVAPAPQTVGRPVYLNATASGSVGPTFVFLWGDGTVNRSRSGHGLHVYVRAGAENATVILLDPNGSAAFASLQLLVEGGPTGAIEAALDPVDQDVPDQLEFDPDLASGIPPFVVNWSYPGGVATDRLAVNPAFPNAGNVTIRATVTDSTGLTGTVVRTIEVNPDPIVLVRPEYTVDGAPIADAATPVSFVANISAGTPAYSLAWMFGDGTTGTGITVTHTYANGPADVTLTLTVDDAGGDSERVTVPVHVFAPLAITSLNVSATTVRSGTPVVFLANSTGGDGDPSVAWTFGDGARTTGAPTATHRYVAPGTYTVTVWVNDSAGSLASRTITVAVTTPAGTPLSVSPLVAVAGLVGALLVVGVATGLVVRRRRRRSSVDLPPETS